MTTATRTNLDGQPRKTLASQIDRLDGILDGLDAALAGAAQETVEQAVKQAVQAMLTEVLTNRDLQEQLQLAAQPALPPEEPRGEKDTPNRLWQVTTENVRRTVQMVTKLGRGVGMALDRGVRVIVAGDFNAGSDSPAVTQFTQAGFVEVLPGGIDHLLLPKDAWGWKLTEASWTFRPENLGQLIGRRVEVSDHPAIIADLLPEP